MHHRWRPLHPRLRPPPSAIEASGWECQIGEVVSGKAPGVDALGDRWSIETGRGESTPFPAKWHLHDKAAGPIRNQEMAEYADALIAIWDGKSRGTKNMIITAYRLGLDIYIHNVSGGPPYDAKKVFNN